QGEAPQGQLPLNGVSFLNRIKVIGHDGDRSEELPTLEFGYTRFEPEARKFFPLKGSDLPARSLANPDLELADLFGNGLADILEMNGTVRYWRNLGGGRFDLPREMQTAPIGLRLADQGVQLIDANGDGRALEEFPNINFSDPRVKFADMTGDGLQDIVLVHDGHVEYWPSLGRGDWGRRISMRNSPRFPYGYDPKRILVGDVDGDGVAD